MRGTTPEILTKGAARRACRTAECESQRATRDDALEDYATTTITNHDTRRTTAATRCEELFVPGRVDTARRESAGDGVTEFTGHCARCVKNILCKFVQLLQALVHQR